MKKSASVSEKLLSPGLPGLQVATRLVANRVVGIVVVHMNRVGVLACSRVLKYGNSLSSFYFVFVSFFLVSFFFKG